jgi:hypothetical protein
MNIERRDFIKIGSAGFAFPFGTILEPALASGELEGGTGSLHLDGRMKAGTLSLQAQDFILGTDRTLIIHSVLGGKKFSSAVFSHDLDRTVFAILADEGHSTSLVFSDTDAAETGSLTVLRDTAVAENYRIKKRQFLKNEYAVDENGKQIDFLGKIVPADFQPKELETVFGNDPELMRFMRGKRSHHRPKADHELLEWICRFLSALPGWPFGLFWAARGDED